MSQFSLTKDGRRALDGSLVLWDAETCTILRSLTANPEPGGHVKLSADGSRAVVSSGVTPLTFWDVENAHILRQINNWWSSPAEVDLSADGNRALVLSSDGKHIAVLDFASTQARVLEWREADRHRAARSLDLASNQARVSESHPARLISAVLSPDGRRVIAGTDIRLGGQDWLRPAPSFLLIWDLDHDEAPPRRIDGQAGGISRIHLNADGRRAVTCGLDCAVIYWDLETGEILQRLTGHKECLWAVALSPDERYAVSGGEDRKIILWDLREGKVVNSLWLNSPIKELVWAGNRIVAVSRGLTFLELQV